MMKRFLALLLTLAIALPLFSCTPALNPMTEGEEVTETQNTETPEKNNPTTANTNTDSPRQTSDEKRAIFIGNSFTYYGKCVLPKPSTNQRQSQRDDDKGYFYQIAKQNGVNIDVTNWTYGGHSLADTIGGNCAAGKGCDGHDHAKDLTNRYYDYVMFQERSQNIGNFMESVNQIISMFREANPNVKFFCLVPLRFYELGTDESTQYLNSLKTLESLGVTVVDWGKLIYDVYTKDTKVPGGKLTYDRHSFVISQSKTDGRHQNMLAGYITALMTWCAITGDSAVGQEYSFTGDPKVNSAFDFDQFRSSYYTYGGVATNFDQALKSKDEVTGFQKLIDQYLSEKGYRNYV